MASCQQQVWCNEAAQQVASLLTVSHQNGFRSVYQSVTPAFTLFFLLYVFMHAKKNLKNNVPFRVF
jgi:hypothetical protein